MAHVGLSNSPDRRKPTANRSARAAFHQEENTRSRLKYSVRVTLPGVVPSNYCDKPEPRDPASQPVQGRTDPYTYRAAGSKSDNAHTRRDHGKGGSVKRRILSQITNHGSCIPAGIEGSRKRQKINKHGWVFITCNLEHCSCRSQLSACSLLQVSASSSACSSYPSVGFRTLTMQAILPSVFSNLFRPIVFSPFRCPTA